MKRRLAIALASGVLATGIVGASTPAFAAIDFQTATWSVGGINYKFEYTSSDAYMGSLIEMTTGTQSNYEVNYGAEFYVGVGANTGVDSSYPKCYTALSTETTDAATGDVTISCGEAPWSVNDPDLFASGSTRLYNDIPMARNVYVLENRGTTDINLGDDAYFYEYFDNYSRGASSEDPTSCAALTAEDHWVVSSDTDDSMIIGYAWQALGASAFDVTGEDCTNSDVHSYLTDTIIPAGATLTIMNFQYSVDGGSSTGDMDAAYAALLPKMAMFDALDDTLCRGIEAGTEITGWGTCAAPALPDTGADTSVIGASSAIAAGLLAAGALALIMVRRRQSAK